MIVDNAAEQVYVVVEPHQPRNRKSLDAQAIAADLGGEGGLAKTLDGYEFRQSQVDMSRAVTRSFEEDGLAMIEAGTGTGKSFAYLFPAVRFAKANQQKVVISTNTINLQTQLIEKDAPQVAAALGEDVKVVLLKGRGNYLCKRKLKEAISEVGLFDHEEARRQLERIAEFAEHDQEGSRQSLGFKPDSEVWERVQSETDTSLRVKCPHYNECFFYNSRREAATADVVVANHHLLLSDLEIRGEIGFGVTALLPPYSRLVVDEAHHLEDAATRHMASRTSLRGLSQILGRLLLARKKPKGRLPQLANRVAELTSCIPLDQARTQIDLLNHQVIPAHRRLLKDLERGFLELQDGFEKILGGVPPLGREERRRVVPGLRHTEFFTRVLVPRVKSMASQITLYTELLGDRLRSLQGLPEEAVERLAGAILEVRSGQRRLEDRAVALRDFLGEGEDSVRWIEYKRTRSGTILRLCQAPIEVGGRLRELLFDRLSTVVLTSATLQSDHGFDYLRRRLGLGDQVDRLETLALPSPFDFAKAAFVGVPLDLPLPNARDFPSRLANLVLEATTLSEGRAFLLFTSYRLLNQVHDLLQARLRVLGLIPLRQGSEDRYRLLERFKKGVGVVLFATSSFWEGVDVPGDALKLVILTKLPFSVPDEPILEARTERIAAEGGDPFREYSVPQAVLKFRQGFGRLIRTQRDHGAVLVTDRRMIEKNYGRRFVDGLPVSEVHRGESAELLGKMKAFFQDHEVSSPSSR
jgi:ATP-dependent DNA helicase DinG